MRTLLCTLMLLALALDGPLAAGKAPPRHKPAKVARLRAPKLPRAKAPRPPRHHR